ncbi:hypothetical protein [Jiella sonneratiae]|uniref:Uncharacterized protein n=1 Tax=Jiella sonneratiae TaxID=2816856 RepID=A0ABS3J631_9HYPH|nr:hypothetical protein [Jiella sonneratiae]MBO0904600.1 hypothetical protein [Jiella sonneratiae]
MAAADPDLVARLKPVRLPPGFDALDWNGILAVFALALVAGLVLALILRAFTAPRLSEGEAAERALAAERGLSPADRLLGQSRLVARLARRQDGGRAAAAAARRLAELKATIDAELYRREPALDPDAVEAAILEALGRRG